MSESFTDTPLLTARFDDAIHYATRHHARQLRKGTPIPYAAHLLAAASLVLEMHGDQGQGIAPRIYYRGLAAVLGRERGGVGDAAQALVDELGGVVGAIAARAVERQGPDTRKLFSG